MLSSNLISLGRARGCASAVLLAIGCLMARSAGAAPAATQPAEAARAEALVRQLDDADAQVRRTASLQLNSLGGEALPVVEAAAKDQDRSPELRRRLQVALKFLRPRAQRERLLRERLAWGAAAWRAAYDRAGDRDPAWDADARRAIELYLQTGSDPTRGTLAQRDAAIDALTAAVAKGCSDPMVQSLKLFMDGTGSRESTRMRFDNVISPTLRACLDRDYPPSVKLQLVEGYMDSAVLAEPRVTMKAIDLLPGLAAQSGMPKGELDALAYQFYEAAQRCPSGSSIIRPFLNAYKQGAPHTAGPLILEAREQMNDAHNIVGQMDPEFHPESWQRVSGQILIAEQALAKAWAIDPSDANIPTLMITLTLVDGISDRKTMELWYGRAMELDPDNYEACARKLEYLYPSKRGSPAEMLTFGRQCLKTENWRGRIPLVLIRTHEFLAPQTQDTREYFEQPDVWQDIRDVYEGAVLNFPNNTANLCAFARYAAKCGHWDVARTLFTRIGDHPDITVFGSVASYNYLRRKADRSGAPATRPIGP